MTRADKLYTPELLALAVELGAYPLDEGLPCRGQARSQSCGSTLTIGLETDENGRIRRCGLRAQACAVGQAAATIFARHAVGREVESLNEIVGAIEGWLAGSGVQPAWPDFEVLAAARDYPGRHGAIVLPWKAALNALSTRSGDG